MAIKISTTVDEKVWEEFKELSDETHQSITGLLTEALKDFVRKKRVRPVFIEQMGKSIEENEKLGQLLAK
ncbi:MAG: hypothetical protein A3H42_04285 [Deltaproteobacteria bacterium RIFCSPLOWO2_02_FULL_46_8]|nr:MAG: hypothetical protein A3H42_04285 [Deltaproteobacteria bacterium RIFCSPLOWO2_02_FULL_46_8]